MQYSIHAFKRSAINRRIAIKRSATVVSQIVMFKRRTAICGAWNWKPRHSALRHVYCRSVRSESILQGSVTVEVYCMACLPETASHTREQLVDATGSVHNSPSRYSERPERLTLSKQAIPRCVHSDAARGKGSGIAQEAVERRRRAEVQEQLHRGDFGV